MPYASTVRTSSCVFGVRLLLYFAALLCCFTLLLYLTCVFLNCLYYVLCIPSQDGRANADAARGDGGARGRELKHLSTHVCRVEGASGGAA
jgi:hypothetical protein